MDLDFHCNEDVHVALESESYVPANSANLLTLHTVQANQIITVDATGVQQVSTCWVEV